MAEMVLSAFLEPLCEKLVSAGASLFLEMVKKEGKIDLETTVQEWKKNLRKINALLRDAEGKQAHDEAVKEWLKDVQDLAFDMEDILDHFATQAQLHQLDMARRQDADEEDGGSKWRDCRCLPSGKNMVKSIMACGSRVVQRFHYSGGDLSSIIEETNNRLQTLYNEAGNLGITKCIIAQEKSQYSAEAERERKQRETGALVCEPVLYGREVMKKEIIERLLKEDPSDGNYVVIPIVGSGGIGKTTLAQHVYNDEQHVKGHFALKAWVCVSDVFDVTRVTTAIVNSFTDQNLNFGDLNQAQQKLLNVVKDKKFLVILDDVWTEEYEDWRQLQTPFQYGKKGSKIVITTRNASVARKVNNNCTVDSTRPIQYNLKGLSDDDCWNIFKQHANIRAAELVDMRNDIVEKCKGSPLAAKALGGVIRNTVDKSECLSILNSHILEIQGSNILPVLRLSYHHLPPHLKHTFAYCSILPKDYNFTEMEVISLWMAQGFIPESKTERMEVIGRRYFLDLVSRSLFEHSPSDGKCFVMHDLIHDLAQWAVGDICCCVMGTVDMEKDLKSTRHLNLTANFADQTSRLDQSVVAQLRTFICLDKSNIDGLNIEFQDFISRFRYIRTLHLASEQIEELPECIGDLKHLRFLNLQFKKLKVLPESIRKLCNLQTLFLIGSDNMRELTNIKYLVQLRYLRLILLIDDSTRVDGLELLLLPSCIVENGLELYGYMGLTFPSWVGDCSFNNIVDIKLVQCRKCECMPPFGQLPSLEKLLVVGMDGIKQVGLEFYGGDGCSNSFPRLKSLEFARMSSWEKWLHPMVDNSKVLFPKLEKLIIKYCPSLQGNLPSHLPSLKILDIDYCNEMSVLLPSILPLLEELSIIRCKEFSTDTSAVVFCSRILVLAKIGSVCSDLTIGWPCCEVLKIKECEKLQSVEFMKSSSSFASSKVNISIGYCETLVNVGQIPLTVESLKLRDCPCLESLWFSDKTQEAEEEACCSGVKGTTQQAATAIEYGVGLGASNKQQQLLHYFPSQIELPHLTKLYISFCPILIPLPDDLLLPSIQRLYYDGYEKLEALPKQMHNFTSLETLFINQCPQIQKLPEGILPTSLKTLLIDDMSITQPIGDWGLNHLTNLQTLMLDHNDQDLTLARCSSELVGSIPGPDLNLPSSLSFLRIEGFSNLKAISCSSFPNLTELLIFYCPKLESLGDKNCLPPNLQKVWVDNCPLIEQVCKPDPKGLIILGGDHNWKLGRYSLS